ncbi:MAG: response regulator [Gemmatimonadetes bacterium]|nr:response regulator [Gemmatimonadota bacterium]
MARTLILVADDNPDSRAIMGLILEHRGYDVSTAADGEEAIREARERHPDLILMDLQMPRLSGLEAALALKEDVSTSDIPILAVTAATIDEDIREHGFCGLLRKPVLPRHIVSAVEVCCSRGSPAPEWLEVDGLLAIDEALSVETSRDGGGST